jgi:thiol-disulfide isomerase/thioredoxin
VRRDERKAPRLGLAVAISGLILVAVVVGYTLLMPAQSFFIGVGAKAPDFELPIVDAQGVSQNELALSTLKGKIVFLEFMASWCKACQEMAPAVESLRLVYEPKGVVFLSVAGSQRGATPATTAEFIRSYDTNWTYLYDSENVVFSGYGVEETPTFFILDEKGMVASRVSGVTPTQSFVQALDAVLSAA